MWRENSMRVTRTRGTHFKNYSHKTTQKHLQLTAMSNDTTAMKGVRTLQENSRCKVQRRGTSLQQIPNSRDGGVNLRIPRQLSLDNETAQGRLEDAARMCPIQAPWTSPVSQWRAPQRLNERSPLRSQRTGHHQFDRVHLIAPEIQIPGR